MCIHVISCIYVHKYICIYVISSSFLSFLNCQQCFSGTYKYCFICLLMFSFGFDKICLLLTCSQKREKIKFNVNNTALHSG